MAFSFADFINSQEKKVTSSTGGNQIKPKNGNPIRVPSGQTLYFRLLPSVYPDHPELFVTEFRQIFIPIVHQDRSKTSRPVVLAPLYRHNGKLSREETDFEKDINRWAEEGKLQGKFGPNRPRPTFYMNVVPIDAHGNMEVDQNGRPTIHILQMTITAYRSLLELLQSGMSNPIPVSAEYPFSFISDKPTCVIGLKAPAPNTRDSYQFIPTMHKVAAMPADWNKLDEDGHPVYAEDIKLLSTPTEEIQPDAVEYLRNTLDGKVEGSTKAPTSVQTNPYGQKTTQTQDIKTAPVNTDDPFGLNGKMPWDDPNAAAPSQPSIPNPSVRQQVVPKEQPQINSQFNDPFSHSAPQPSQTDNSDAEFNPTQAQKQQAQQASEQGKKDAEDIIAQTKEQLKNIING